MKREQLQEDLDLERRLHESKKRCREDAMSYQP